MAEGQQLARIEHLAAAGSHHGIAGVAAQDRADSLQIALAAVVVELGLAQRQPQLLQIRAQLPPQLAGGLAAAQQQRPAAERLDRRPRLCQAPSPRRTTAGAIACCCMEVPTIRPIAKSPL